MSADNFDSDLARAEIMVIKAVLFTMLVESKEMSTAVKYQLELLKNTDPETTKPLDPETNLFSQHLDDRVQRLLADPKNREEIKHSDKPT